MIVRVALPLVALLTALTSLAVTRLQPTADAAVCQRGACRYEDLMTGMEAAGATPEALAAMLREDVSNPHMWASYGDYLTGIGDLGRADAAFAQAEATGAGLAPVLMRSANFAFTHDRIPHGLQLVPRILEQTSDFDEVLFAYLDDSGRDAAALTGTIIPPTARAGRAWMAWMVEHAAPRDVMTTWSWLHGLHLVDERTAANTVVALWRRKAVDHARQVWLDTRGPDWYAHGNLLGNASFSTEPSGTPFDWTLAPSPGVEFVLQDGLTLHFTGTNLTDAGVVQYAVVSPGLHRFTATVRVDALTTDEGVWFDIADAEDPARSHAQTAPLLGTLARTAVSVDVPVSADTHVLRVQLRRRSSLKFDNGLTGTLHVHHVELVAAE